MPRSPAAAALLGRDGKRSALGIGLALVLFVCVSLLSDLAGPRGLDVIDGRVYLVVAFVLVVGGGLAAANAYWNDGLALSWLLVFALALGWAWDVFVRGPVFPEEAIVPLAWAMFAALVVGTVGYALGRRRGAPSRVGEPPGWLLGPLLGRDPARPVRWGLLAGGLALAAGALVYTTRPFLPLPVEGVSLLEVFTVGGVFAADAALGVVVLLAWVGLAAWPAYRDAGLLASWGLPFGPVFGAVATDFVTDGISGSGPAVDATFAFLLALGVALVVGTAGFALGTGLRRVATRGDDRRERDASA